LRWVGRRFRTAIFRVRFFEVGEVVTAGGVQVTGREARWRGDDRTGVLCQLPLSFLLQRLVAIRGKPPVPPPRFGDNTQSLLVGVIRVACGYLFASGLRSVMRERVDASRAWAIRPRTQAGWSGRWWDRRRRS
jgi:hypothetical protein